MEVILHIGSNKTGSTALQQSLYHHQADLLSCGVYYPDTGRPNHSNLLLKWIEDDEFRDSFGRHDPNKRDRGASISDDLWRDVVERGIADKQPDKLILSSEYIMGMRPLSLQRMLEYLWTLSTSVSAVGFFRSPESHYLSAMQQRVKYGYEMKSPFMPMKYTKPAEKLRRANISNLYLRRFERKDLINESVVEDFCLNYLRLPCHFVKEMEKFKSNVSISAEGMVLMSDFNRTTSPKRRVAGNRLSNLALSALSRAESIRRYSKPRLTPYAREVIRETCRPDLLSLRDRFGITFSDVDYSTETVHVPNDKEDWRVEDVVQYNPSALVSLRTDILDILGLGSCAPEVPRISEDMSPMEIDQLNNLYKNLLRKD